MRGDKVNIVISFFLLIALLMIGIPVSFTFFAAVLYLLVTGDYSISFVAPYAFSKLSSIIIMATPMYVMAGGIIEKGDLGNRLVDFIELFFGRFKGGLGVVAVLSCAMFGAISGSATATETVIGSIMWPRLDKAGYDKGVTASLISSCCLLGSYIPPSAMMIIFAWLCDLSVLGCFLAVLGPGLILMIAFSVWIFVKCRKDPNVKVIKFERTPAARKARRATVVSAIPALMFPIIILGGIYGGIFTPTEAAAVATLYAIPVTIFIYHGMTFRELLKTFSETATMSGVIMFMLFCVMMLARIYTTENLPTMMLEFTQSVTDNKYLVLLFINLIYIALGMLMDDTSAMTLAAPILLPVAVGMGIDPYHFAAITAVNLGLGCVTPPCAPLLYLGSKLSDTPVTKLMRSTGSIIFWIWIPIIIVVTFLPAVSTFLPSLIGK